MAPSATPSRLKSLAPDDLRLALPLYTLSEAARYLRLPQSTLHTWARPSDREPLVTTFGTRGRAPTMPFIGFAEAFVVNAAKRAGVPNHRIRPGVEKIKRRAGGVPHALASRLVYTDGAALLLEELDDGDLEEAHTDQRQFRKAVESQLKLISWADDGFAERLRLPQFERAEVVVDPGVASGHPLVRRGAGVRVKDLVESVRAGDSPHDVARGFGVPLKEVQEVLREA